MWSAIIGATASLAGTAAQIGLGINSLKQNKESLKQAQENLAFQKSQYDDQKKNYDGYMNQTQESANAYGGIKRKEDKKETIIPAPMDKI